MSESNERRRKGGGSKVKRAEAGSIKRRLQECALSAWRDLRAALEVGTAEGAYVTSIELIGEEPIKANLTISDPRALEEERLTNSNAKRLMSYELADLSREREEAIQRVARRAAAAPSVGGDNGDSDRSEASTSSHDDEAIEAASVANEVKLWRGVKSKPSDFRGATTVYGPDVACAHGKGAMDQQEVVDSYLELVNQGQCVLELDIMETGPEHTLIGVAVKDDAEDAIGYAVSVALGAKATKVKLRESELKSCAAVRSATKQTLGRLRQLKLDVAKALCDEESSIKEIEQLEWSQELKAAFRELPPGAHAKRAEGKIRVVKDKMRPRFTFVCLFLICFYQT